MTKGGHITVKNVGGDLVATTGGGHITAGTIGGIATLHTDGGHIQVTSIGGPGHLSTGGGNVYVEHSATSWWPRPWEADRSWRGGGPSAARRPQAAESTWCAWRDLPNLETGGGSIYLTQVDGT